MSFVTPAGIIRCAHKYQADDALQAARARLNSQIDGIDFTIEDIYTMQQLCPYEVRFCLLPTAST